MTVEIRYTFGTNYVWKLRYSVKFLVTLDYNQKMTKNYVIIT